MIDGFLVFGVELDRALKRFDCALELSLVVEDCSQEKVCLRDGLDLHGFLEELLRAKQLSLARVDRAKGKVGEERVLRNLNRAAQPALGAFQILTFV